MKSKVGQSLVYGLPVVTTPIGAEGMGLDSERNVLIAENAQSFAEGVVRLHEDHELWQRLSTNGLRHTQHGMFNPVFRFGCEGIELAYRLAPAGLKAIHNQKARSTMFRALTLPEFWRRVELQGRSNRIFSQLHANDEIRRWTDTVDVDRRWSNVAARFPLIMKSALDLDRMAQARQAQGFDLDETFTTLLHLSYRTSIDCARLRGMYEASRSGHR